MLTDLSAELEEVKHIRETLILIAGLTSADWLSSTCRQHLDCH